MCMMDGVVKVDRSQKRRRSSGTEQARALRPPAVDSQIPPLQVLKDKPIAASLIAAEIRSTQPPRWQNHSVKNAVTAPSCEFKFQNLLFSAHFMKICRYNVASAAYAGQYVSPTFRL